jgi:hypothetical protein
LLEVEEVGGAVKLRVGLFEDGTGQEHFLHGADGADSGQIIPATSLRASARSQFAPS